MRKQKRVPIKSHRVPSDDRKDKRISPMAARIRKAGYKQELDGDCVVCGEPYVLCPHAIPQIDMIIDMVRADDIAHGEAV